MEMFSQTSHLEFGNLIICKHRLFLLAVIWHKFNNFIHFTIQKGMKSLSRTLSRVPN